MMVEVDGGAGGVKGLNPDKQCVTSYSFVCQNCATYYFINLRLTTPSFFDNQSFWSVLLLHSSGLLRNYYYTPNRLTALRWEELFVCGRLLRPAVSIGMIVFQQVHLLNVAELGRRRQRQTQTNRMSNRGQ